MDVTVGRPADAHLTLNDLGTLLEEQAVHVWLVERPVGAPLVPLARVLALRHVLRVQLVRQHASALAVHEAAKVATLGLARDAAVAVVRARARRVRAAEAIGVVERPVKAL